MLEIFAIIALAKHLASTATAKGHSGMWGGLGVAAWIGGEITGMVIGSLMGLELGAYGLALGGAITGAIVAHVVVKNLPDRRDPSLEGIEDTFR
jgi:hypothetical protein